MSAKEAESLPDTICPDVPSPTIVIEEPVSTEPAQPPPLTPEQEKLKRNLEEAPLQDGTKGIADVEHPDLLALYCDIRAGRMTPKEVGRMRLKGELKLRFAMQMYREGLSIFEISQRLMYYKPDALRRRIMEALEEDGRSALALPSEAFIGSAFMRFEDLYHRAVIEGDYGTARLILNDIWAKGQDLGKLPKAPLHTVVELRREEEVPMEERLARIRRFFDMAREEGIVIGVPEASMLSSSQPKVIDQKKEIPA